MVKIKKKKKFEIIIKTGNYLLIKPIRCVFLLDKMNSSKESFINLVGTLVKKKDLENQSIVIE
ncbi:hypothetical protein [Blattabacterium cuenoti]|uniref:hypothetical protein n=1 Tax=Blattabacterium cuenoti TaxID=1653831 RepID=UPI00163B8D42|nr:hypothetical protein [Blattabacterium cuenoti]